MAEGGTEIPQPLVVKLEKQDKEALYAQAAIHLYANSDFKHESDEDALRKALKRAALLVSNL